jgi:hypothetical protein
LGVQREEGNKILLKEIGYEDVDRINLANGKNKQRTLVNMVRNLQVTCKALIS